MLRPYLKLMAHNMANLIDSAVARIDHNAVIKDLTSRVELSGTTC